MSHGKEGMVMDNDTMDGMVMHNDTTDGMVVHMAFFWSKDVVMLFSGWPNGHPAMYILALAFVLFLAAAVEFLSVFPIIRPGSSPLVGGLIHALFYGLRMGLLYLIMLCVMSYNVGVFVFAVVGHVIGCFLVKYRMISRSASKRQTDPV